MGDNPNKDFVNLNSVGAKTIQVMTGPYSKDVVEKSFEASEIINSVSELPHRLGVLLN